MKVTMQEVRYGKPRFVDIIEEEYFGDQYGNISGKTGKSRKVGKEVVGYDFEGEIRHKEIAPNIEVRAGIEIRNKKEVEIDY